MQRSTPLRLAVSAALTLAATTAAQASLYLTENLTGSFNAYSTFGGTAFGANTPFSLTATFDADPSANELPGYAGLAVYPITALSISIGGLGTFAGIAGSSLNVVVSDPNFAGRYSAGIGDSVAHLGIYSFFNSSSASFSATAPGPADFSDPYLFENTLPYTIDLVGVSGGLTIEGTGFATSTASITPVPEPAEGVAAAGLALGAFALLRRSRRGASPTSTRR